MGSPTLVVLGASGDLAARLLFPALAVARTARTARGPPRHRVRPPGVDERAVPREPARRDGRRTSATSTRSTSTRSSTASSSTAATSRSSRCAGCTTSLDGPAIFYLALPPGVFADAAETIAKAGLADETNGWRRLVIEKPFGTDLASALALNEQLHKYWREDQIFRIDHFLGKETVQNILVFRFANRFVEPVLAGRARRRDPDHRGGDARRRGPVALLRRHRRAARHDPEPPRSR